MMRSTIVRNGAHYIVSTVLLPYDSDGRPYETMVFEGDAEGNVTNWSDLSCDRYESLDDAERGHEKTVATWEPTS